MRDYLPLVPHDGLSGPHERVRVAVVPQVVLREVLWLWIRCGRVTVATGSPHAIFQCVRRVEK